MPVDVSKIRFGGYGAYSGPFYNGTRSLIVPDDPTFLQKCMAVVSAVEGHVDAVNMYDSGIVSLGSVQWIERGNMAVSDMMGAVAERCGVNYVLNALAPGLRISNATFRKNAAGKWRFFVKRSENSEVEVSTSELQRECFLGCDGKKESWTPASTSRAKTWCAAFASVWDFDDACTAQLDFSSKRLLSWFVTANAKSILFSDPSEEGWKGALKAIYVSFAVNIPAIADRNLVIGAKASKNPKWSRSWCLDVIEQIVHGSGVAIWPVRYNGLVKRANALFGVDLPPTTKDLALKNWSETLIETPAVMSAPIPALPITPPMIESSSQPNVVQPVPAPIVPAPKPATSSENVGVMIILFLGSLITVAQHLINSCHK
jgi:hypothetical protein